MITENSYWPTPNTWEAIDTTVVKELGSNEDSEPQDVEFQQFSCQVTDFQGLPPDWDVPEASTAKEEQMDAVVGAWIDTTGRIIFVGASTETDWAGTFGHDKQSAVAQDAVILLWGWISTILPTITSDDAPKYMEILDESSQWQLDWFTPAKLNTVQHENHPVEYSRWFVGPLNDVTKWVISSAKRIVNDGGGNGVPGVVVLNRWEPAYTTAYLLASDPVKETDNCMAPATPVAAAPTETVLLIADDEAVNWTDDGNNEYRTLVDSMIAESITVTLLPGKEDKETVAKLTQSWFMYTRSVSNCTVTSRQQAVVNDSLDCTTFEKLVAQWNSWNW
jgi:hypothetical protein